MNLPAWLIEQLQQEQDRQDQGQLEELRLPLYEEEISHSKDDDPKDRYKPVVIEL